MHHADIAEILDELDFDEATYIFKVFEKTSETLLRMIGGEYLKRLPQKRAEELDELNTDDAAISMQSFAAKKRRGNLRTG
jgi:magnesium transporter